MKTIYLDYNATTPIDPEVADEMKPYLEQYFGNPSSIHSYGIKTKNALIKARKQVAELLNCNSDEIVFTSGGTESNNYAIKGFVFANKHKGNHIITSSIEHPAVIEVCKFLEENGFIITYLQVNEYGEIDLEELKNAITSHTILISIMHANNEVGTIQPITEILRIAKKNNITFHTDAAQSTGKIKIDVKELGVDLLSIAGHKLYAPKGVGVLYIKSGIKLQKLIHGADHEQNKRAGTENILEIVGLGKACEIAKRDIENNYLYTKNLRDRLFSGLKKIIPDLKLNGHTDNRLPNTLSISFPEIEANTLLSEIEEVAASAGAACHSEGVDVSNVLTAMNIPIEYAMGTIRFSTGKFNTTEEIDQAINFISKAVKKLKPEKSQAKISIKHEQKIKLTHYTKGMGCACKLRPQELEQVLKNLSLPDNPNILIGTNTADDAAIYKINDNTAIVQTVDFFTPIVDDPYCFGQIAATNALSDIYAMGGKPLFALNIVGFPSKRLPLSVLSSILKGAEDKAKEAGISILGGHSVEDTEPKYGMVVTGIIHPDKIISNANANPGDDIILTKPIGLGIISTAIKRGLTNKETEKYVIELMCELNNKAANIMANFPVNSCTDVTGFGLLGHLKEMSQASKTNAEIFYDKVLVIPDAYDFANANIVPGGSLNNLDFVSEIVEWNNNLSQTERILLCDAQTSGGLLISIPNNYSENFIKELKKNNVVNATIIGKFTNKGEGKISVYK